MNLIYAENNWKYNSYDISEQIAGETYLNK